MITETTAAASKSSKSKSICAAFWSLRFGEPDRASKFFLAIIFHSYCLVMLVAEPLKDENRVTWRAPLFDRNECCWTSIPTIRAVRLGEFSVPKSKADRNAE